MFEGFIQDMRKIRVLIKGEETYLTGTVVDYDQQHQVLVFRGERETQLIPLQTIAHLYEVKDPSRTEKQYVTYPKGLTH